MNAARELVRLDPHKTIVPFGEGINHEFRHDDLGGLGQPTGISLEEGEFLYGLVRIVRPQRLLETGTNVGISASYIALALRDASFGHLTTIEHEPTVAHVAKTKLEEMGLSPYVTVINSRVEEYSPEQKLDFLFLDSELAIRFGELLRFFPHMNPGAIACIHDLWELDFDQFGGVPNTLRELLKTGELRAMTFKTPHGFTVFQKRREKDYLGDIFR